MFEAVEETPERQWTENPPTVMAIVVSRNGARWLPQSLEALSVQTQSPDAVVGVDVSSEDDSEQLLRQRLEEVRSAPAGTGFGDAVRVALEGTEPTEWLWLLHDDCAPDPEALAYLLDAATASPEILVVGPKLREWPSLRRLLEVGVTLTGTGQRETGLERGEPDQGQHDRARDVLAVSTAGMLVRRDIWDRLDGLDPGLPLFGDDIDLGWRVARAGGRVRVAPRAVVFHAEAASQGLRDGSLIVHRHREQRRAALYTLLANASTPGFVWQSVRLLFGSVLRVLGLLLAKAPGEARDEAAGALSLYLHPGAVLRARRSRAQTATRSAKEVRHLLAPTSLPYRHGLDAVAELARAFASPQPALSGRRAAVDPNAAAQEVSDLPAHRNVFLRHPWLGCVLGLVVLALVAGRGLYGSGSLHGGALLASPASAGSWWDLFFSAWHDVGVGSAVPAPPYVLALAVPATLVWSAPGWVVDLLMLGAVPLAALTAHRLARRFFDGHGTQVWFALTYALLAVASGAVTQGRLGTVVALVLAPLVVGSAVALVRGPHWQHGVRLALWLAIATAFAPLAYLMTVVLLLVVAAWRLRGRQLWSVLLALVLPWLLLGSWMWQRALDPTQWWWEAGQATAGVGALDPGVWQLALGRAGGPGGAPAWIGIGLVLGALLALLRKDRRRPVLLAWLVALVSLAFAVLGAGTYFTPSSSGTAVPAWVGFATCVWLAGLAAAAGFAADGAREYVRDSATLRPIVLLVAAAGVLAPVLAAGWWVVGATTGPLQRSEPSAVPAYLVERAESGEATLVIHGTTRDGVVYDIHANDGERLGEEAVAPGPEASASFSRTVSTLLSNPTRDQLDALASYDVSNVYLAPPADEHLSEVLDAAPGLSPSGSPEPDSRVWTFDADADPAARNPSQSRVWVATMQVVVALGVIVAAVPGRRRRSR